MAVSTGTSLALATVSAILIFSGMQMYKPWLVSTQLHTLFGGYLGSLLFLLSLTAIGNLESCWFGKSFQSKLFPEVITSFLFATFSSALIHRVCSTTCIIFSVITLYYVNKYSQKVHVVPVATVAPSGKKKKTN